MITACHLIGFGFDNPNSCSKKQKTNDDGCCGGIDLDNRADLMADDGSENEKQNG